VPEALFVLDQQHGLGATRWRLGWGAGRASATSSTLGRYVLNVVPRPRLAVHPDVSAALLHDAEDHGKTNPVPLPASFVVKNGSNMWAWVAASMP